MTKMTKAARIRRMTLQGKTVQEIVTALKCNTQYVYAVRSKMREGVQKTGINPPLTREAVETYAPEKHEPPPTLWQRFKTAVGF